MSASVTSPGRVVLYYDVCSPYSYVGFFLLRRLRALWQQRAIRTGESVPQVELRPIFLGGIMKATGNQPPAKLPSKGRYLASDMRGQTQYFSLPFTFPADFFGAVTSSLGAQRLLTAVQRTRSPAEVEQVSVALYERIWQRDEDIREPESLLASCKAAGLSEDAAKDLVSMISDSDVKQALMDATNEAIEMGMFGAPFFVCYKGDTREPLMLFGSDRFHLLADYFGLPLSLADLRSPEPVLQAKL